MTRDEAIALRAKMENTYALATMSMTIDQVIENRDLCQAWAEGLHLVDEVRTVEGYPYKCRQEHNTNVYPDIVPGGSAWATFWIPYHGLTPETALPFVAPTGAHDMYLTGEYMIYTDGLLYRCKSDTAYSPTDYTAAWEQEVAE